MIWNVSVTLLLLAVPFIEARQLKREKKKDAVVFGALWLIAFAAMIAECLELPMPLVLDWIRVVSMPINRLIS